MSDERHQELAALYALDLLEGSELAAFETALARDPALGAVVREFRDTSAQFAHVAPLATPPAALRDRVLASVNSAPVSARDRGKVVRFPAVRYLSGFGWAAAAGFALSAAWLGQLYLATRSELAAERDLNAVTTISLKSTGQLLEAERILTARQLRDTEQLVADARSTLAQRDRQLAALTDQFKREGDLANLKIAALSSKLNNSPEAVAIAVWNPAKQEGVLKVEKLPALAGDKDYQLWIVDPQYPNPVDGGVFTVDPLTGERRVIFKAHQPVTSIAAFAVTLERKGGVPKAEGPFVLLGK